MHAEALRPEGGQQYQNAPSQNFDNAAAECGKQGGSWEGDKCYFRDPTMQNIGVDRGGEECVKQGGNWTGNNCNFLHRQLKLDLQAGMNSNSIHYYCDIHLSPLF